MDMLYDYIVGNFFRNYRILMWFLMHIFSICIFRIKYSLLCYFDWQINVNGTFIDFISISGILTVLDCKYAQEPKLL